MHLKCYVMLFAFAVHLRAEQCITPNNENAECISLYSCPLLLRALAAQKSTTVEFVTKSNCGGTMNNPMVCCGSSSEFTESKLVDDTGKSNLLPDRKLCGYQHSDDYYRPTNDIAISEYPWLARIKFKKDDKEFTDFECSGSLISARYVLTLARCLVPAHNVTLESVRLGEYHTQNDTDCVDEDSLVTECSEPVQDIGIEEITTHPNYNRRNRANDIGLLRLNMTVYYTDYVRPICLPLTGSKRTEVGDTLLLSGWGSLHNANRGEVLIKKKIFSTLITNEECSTGYQEHNFTATEGHICTKLLSNNTDYPCKGDSGGPVMASYRLQWFLVGIISFSRNLCTSSTKYAEVHTNVVNYIDWIQENIKQ